MAASAVCVDVCIILYRMAKNKRKGKRNAVFRIIRRKLSILSAEVFLLEKGCGRGAGVRLVLVGALLALAVFLMWYCSIRTEEGPAPRAAVLVRSGREECAIG